MVVEKFQSYSVKIIAIHLWVCWIRSFLIMPPSKTLPQVFIIIIQADGNSQFLSNSVFWRYFFLRRKGERIMELKELPKLTKVSVTSFDKFDHLCNLYIFGLWFVMQQFSFKHAEVWKFFNVTNKIFIKKYYVQE